MHELLRKESKLVLDKLNELVCTTCYAKPFLYNDLNISLIINTLSQGYSVKDCVYVIKNKHTQWSNNPAMRYALQPKFIFSSKFKYYLDEQSNTS